MMSNFFISIPTASQCAKQVTQPEKCLFDFDANNIWKSKIILFVPVVFTLS